VVEAEKLEKDLYSVEKKKKNLEWLEKNAKKMDLEIDDELESKINEMKTEIKQKKDASMLKKQNYSQVSHNNFQLIGFRDMETSFGLA
jgi:hypothetical protein